MATDSNGRLERHRLSELWGDVEGDDATALEVSFADGIDDALMGRILLYEGKVLDGWHRYRHAPDAPMDEFIGSYEEAVVYVITANAARRHNTPEQRAWAIVSMTRWSNVPGRPRENVPSGTFSGDSSGPWMDREEQAHRAGVSERTISRARERWLNEHGQQVRECADCGDAAALPGKRRCQACQDKADSAPTQAERIAAEREGLEEENAQLRGQVETARTTNDDAVEEALRLEGIEARAEASDSRAAADYWKRQAQAAQRKLDDAAEDSPGEERVREDDGVQMQLMEVTRERDVLRSDLDRVSKERNMLQSELASVRKRLEQVTRERDQLQAFVASQQRDDIDDPVLDDEFMREVDDAM